MAMADDKRGFLMNFPVLVELGPEASAEDPDSAVWELADRIQAAINERLEMTGPDLGCHQVIVHDLQDAASNAERCAECGAWTTDWLRVDRIEGLRRGKTIEGRLLCEDELDEQQVARLYAPKAS
jgi:hypothetical protein